MICFVMRKYSAKFWNEATVPSIPHRPFGHLVPWKAELFVQAQIQAQQGKFYFVKISTLSAKSLEA